MPRQTWQPAAARHFGLNVVEVDGANTRGSESFNPGGTTCHHIAGSSSGEAPALGLIFFTGRPDLPPPLANWLLGRPVNGVVRCFFGAAGRANHAGRGGYNGLVGNSSVIGIEPENDGRQPWPHEQIEAYHRLVAAMQWGMKRGAEWGHGHKEWTPRKPDPHTLNMNEFRGHVATILANPNPGPTPPAPGDEMPNPAIVVTPDGTEWNFVLSNQGIWMSHGDTMWSRVPGGVLTSAPDAVVAENGQRVMIFAAGQDGELWSQTYKGGWHGWRKVGGKMTSAPSASLHPSGAVIVTVRGTDTATWKNVVRFDPSGDVNKDAWEGWRSLGGSS